MIDKFLKAKHWQIFMLTLGLPFILQIIITIMMFTNGDPSIMMKIMPIISIVFMIGFFGWFWSVAIGLQSKIPPDVNLNVRRFKIFLFIPIIYIILLFGFMGNMFEGAFENGTEPGNAVIGSILGIIIPMHLFSMFCIFYCLYFVAKTFKTAELQREVTFADFAGEFFLFWFFPIGVWILQPKINKIIE
jgi:hypothetical protein